MASKASKWGLKIWALADSNSNYLYNWKLYEGKEGNKTAKHLAMNVVLNLVKDLNNRGHRLTTDNYYTSVNLAIEL
jgi:hypothetical protein